MHNNNMMASISVKFRPSAVEGQEGGHCLQIIHNRVVRQLHTDYKMLPGEWDAGAECVIVAGRRSGILCEIR